MIGILAANLLRRPGRTFLTSLGTAIGVATIVALLSITDGLQATAGQLVNLGRADLGLFQVDAADLTTSVIPEELAPRLEKEPGITRAQPIQLLVEQIKQEPSAIIFGAKADGFLVQRLVTLRGRALKGPSEIVIGDRLAKSSGLDVGDTLKVADRRLPIVGVYHSGVVFEDSGAAMALRTAQEIAGRPGEVTTIAVQLDPDARPEDVRAALRRSYPGLVAISEPSQAVRGGANGQLIEKAATVIVVLALLIGGIAVMNTMLLVTLERQSEFAVMSAVGWSPLQVAGMVLGEGAATGVLGAGIGVIVGIFGSDLLVNALGASGFVDPRITASVLVRGLVVGGIVGVIGGLYPAWRVARLRPAPVLAGH